MIVLDIIKYPVPKPDGPCTYCLASVEMGFDPIISNGVGGGFVWCPACNTEWYMCPSSHTTTVSRHE